MLDIKSIYQESGALLNGHFLLTSGKHSSHYLQSAKVLESPKRAETLAKELANQIQSANVVVETVCSPAIGGLLAGYELARALNARFIFTERANGVMTLRRGFEVSHNEKILVCEDIITTGGSAMEAKEVVEKLGAAVVAFAALANRGYCKRVGGNSAKDPSCKLSENLPLFALDDFVFPIYSADECPLCKDGSQAIKPGSRGN